MKFIIFCKKKTFNRYYFSIKAVLTITDCNVVLKTYERKTLLQEAIRNKYCLFS